MTLPYAGKYVLTSSDRQIIMNLRHDYPAIEAYQDEAIAHAWREYSLSDEYQHRHDQPELFLEWVEMANNGTLS